MDERKPGGERLRNGSRSLFSAGLGLILAGLLASFVDAAPQGPSPGDRSFGAFVASLWPAAAERGVKRQTFDRAFAGVVFDPKVVASANRQAEFTQPIWAYIASAVSSARIARGREKVRADRAWLDEASKTFGVDEGVIMGVWGLETDFGQFPGTANVIQSLASLAYVRFRDDYFRDELLAALMMLEDFDIEPGAMRGSWAGAMGQTQFMPSSYLVYAVDFERNGKRDIWTSEADVIGSIANFLASNGWKPGLPWGFEVVLPSGFGLIDADSSTRSPFANFAARGVRRADGGPLPEKGEGRLFLPAGLKGPVFLITSNFEVIKTYNASTSYALAVALLGDAIEGGNGLVADWPRKDRPLGPDEVRRLQTRLKRLGFDPGDVDGMVGDSLRAAVRAYQERNGLTPDGYASLALLRRIDHEK